MKVTGREFSEFDCALSGYWWFPDAPEWFDNSDGKGFADDELLEFRAGDFTVAWQGPKVQCKARRWNGDTREVDTGIHDLYDWFLEWRAQKTHATLLAEIEHTKVEQFRAYVESIGGKVLNG